MRFSCPYSLTLLLLRKVPLIFIIFMLVKKINNEKDISYKLETCISLYCNNQKSNNAPISTPYNFLMN